MDQHIYSDDVFVETTLNNNHIIHSDNNSDIHNDNHSDDDAPAAAGTMMLAEQYNATSSYTPAISTLSYTGSKVLSLLSWIGSGLYSLTGIFSNTVNSEEQHMHVLNTIAKLNNHLIFLDKKIESMNRNSARFSEQAKRLYKSKKIPSAMHQIRLKKMYDCEINKLEKLKFNMETNILHMDSVEILMVTVDTIKDTSEHFQKINSTLNIEKLEDTIDELVEHRDSATDIQSVLSDMQLFNDANYDEADLMKELKMLSNEDVNIDNTIIDGKSASSPQSTIRAEDLPEAPSTALLMNTQENDTQIITNITENTNDLSVVL